MKTMALTGVVGWDITADGVREFLRNANGDDVMFECSSPGGYIAPGLEIFNLIRNYPGQTTAKLCGYAMSMMSYIPLACDKVIAEDNAVYMIHNARGGSWGDHNDILGYGAFLKGLSGVIAKQYVKRTGKALADITELMDKETYFFGDEMVEAGFVDEIIKTDKGDDDKASAIATAKAVFSDAMAKLSSEVTKQREDINLAAAALSMNITVPVASVTVPPAPAAGNKHEEVQQMNLNELLAANPAARAEYDAALAKARTEGEASVTARIDKVAPFLHNSSYGSAITKVAVAVLKGEDQVGSLNAAVAAVDAVREEKASQAAAAGTAGQQETGGAGTPGKTDEPGAVVSDDDALDAAIEKAKGGAR